jgi:hypothetical protein
MNKQIKILMSVIVLVLLVQGVYSAVSVGPAPTNTPPSIFATIGMQGLSMASPEAGQIISNVVCVSNPVGCLEGKAIGMVQSEALQTLAEQSPEIAKAVTTYNQVKGYIDTGAEITQDLKVNEEGGIEEGIIQFKDKEGRFGNLVGKDIKQKEIYGKEIELNKKDGISTISFTGENSYINVKDDLFKDIKASGEDNEAYIKLNGEGNVQEADITASKDTSFVFGEKRIDVKEGTRVFYQYGRITINGKTGDEINLMDKVTDENGGYIFSNSNKVKMLEFSKGRLLIEGNTIRGTHFQIGDLRFRNDFYSEVGEVTLVPEGYLLGTGTGTWKGMEFETGSEDTKLLLTDSEIGLDKYENWVFLGETKLKANQRTFEMFDIKFKENNPYAKIEPNDYFNIRANEGFSLELENRDSIGKIPKMVIGGEFHMDQNAKNIFNSRGKIGIKAINAAPTWRPVLDKKGTSPIELLFKDNEENLRPEKYIVSNFKGIATVPLDASEGITDERYSNSIYNIRAQTGNRYNYPTIEDFEKISGKKLSFPGQKLEDPVQIRKIIDFYETLPEDSKRTLQSLKIHEIGSESATTAGLGGKTIGITMGKDRSIHLLSNTDIGTFRHEAAHNYNELRIVKDIPSFLKERWETYQTDKTWNDMDDPEFNNKWLEIVGGKEIYKKYYGVNTAGESKSWGNGAKYGFVRNYGNKAFYEDVATYVEEIVSNPSSFSEGRLIGFLDGELESTIYQKKIDLLKEYEYITPLEYDAVMKDLPRMVTGGTIDF